MRLVTLDLDGTLIRTTVFDAVARGLGLASDVRAYDELYARGVLSLEATFIAEYELFLGARLQDVEPALARGSWLRNIAGTVAALRSKNIDVWVVTDQPSWAVAHLARWGIRDGVWSQAATRGGRVGAITRQVFAKWPALAQKLAAARIDPAHVCHVGNGTNDVPIFEAVGRAIAFNPAAAEVERAADAVVRGDDLAAILPHVV